MINPLHFLRMSRWARNPPSAARVKFVIVVILMCAMVFLIERYVGWPASITPNTFKLPA